MIRWSPRGKLSPAFIEAHQFGSFPSRPINWTLFLNAFILLKFCQQTCGNTLQHPYQQRDSVLAGPALQMPRREFDPIFAHALKTIARLIHSRTFAPSPTGPLHMGGVRTA